MLKQSLSAALELSGETESLVQTLEILAGVNYKMGNCDLAKNIAVNAMAILKNSADEIGASFIANIHN